MSNSELDFKRVDGGVFFLNLIKYVSWRTTQNTPPGRQYRLG